jgi:hypothetical protein
MSDSKDHSNVLRAAISVFAIGFIVVHLVYPDISIDQITITLFIVAIVPWLSSIFKSLDLPGVGKMEYQQFKEKIGPILTKETEPIPPPTGRAASLDALMVNDYATIAVIKALANPKYTWRYLGGLKEETGCSEKDVLTSLEWLKANDLIAESSSVGERLWALSQRGREKLIELLKS